MTRIGLLSDTHSYWDDKYLKYFESCDEIWHAGDIGALQVAEKLDRFKVFRAVHGNIDGQDVRIRYPQHLKFQVEGVSVWMTHIGGYPGKYSPAVFSDLVKNPPRLFVCGHSHILKVQYDRKLNMLCVNPGAAGRYGMHTVRTLVRFSIHDDQILDLEVIELGASSGG